MAWLWTLFLYQEGPVVIQVERCVFTPDESANVPSLLNHKRTQVKALSDLTHRLGDLVNQWLGSWFLVEKIVTYFGKDLNLCFLLHVPILLLWSLPPRQPGSCQASNLHASETPCSPFRARCGRGVPCDIVRAGHEPWGVEEVLARMWPLVDPWAAFQGFEPIPLLQGMLE